MSDIVLARPEKTSAFLVTFTFGDGPTVIRYTDWTSAIIFLGRRYEAVPKMSIDIPANTGGLKESPLGITLPLNSFTSQISNSEAHATVDVEVRELIQNDQDGHAPIIFRGRVHRPFQNFQGRSGSVRLICINVKQRLSVPLGMAANFQCAWTFGGPGCDINASGLRENATIASIDRSAITLTGLTTTIVMRYWERGNVQIDGLSILVRKYDTGTGMILVRDPPRRWLGKVAVLTPGCDKTIEVCRATWNNEGRFCGLGYAIPAYHPVVEAP